MDHGKHDHKATEGPVATARVVILGAVVVLLAIGVIALFTQG